MPAFNFALGFNCRRIPRLRRKPTYLSVVLVALALCLSSEAYARQQNDSKADRYEQAKRHFPTVDYNEPALPDTEENRAKREKRKRFNELGNWVFANTRPDIAEHRSAANYFNFPPLPAAQSDIIVIAVVSEAEAHLSENKRNVFSEFELVVEAVLKTSNPAVRQSSIMTVDRMGAFVRYPSGHTVLYQRAGVYMPKVGGRYLFFLKSPNSHDYGILTAYELTEAGVIPLDMATEFFVLEGKSETDILRTVRGLLSTPTDAEPMGKNKHERDEMSMNSSLYFLDSPFSTGV